MYVCCGLMVMYNLLHMNKGLYTEGRPSCICSALHTLSGICNKLAQCSCEMPQVDWSSMVYVHFSPISDHPQLVGGGSSGSGNNIWPHTCPPWYTALLTCSFKAAFVGGISCILLFLAKSFLLSLLMSVHLLVRSYISITNLSMMLIALLGISAGAKYSNSNASVSSGSTVQTPMQSSCYVWQSWRQCHNQSEHGTFVMHKPCFVQVQLQFRALVEIENFGQFQKLAIVCLVD